TRHGFDIGRVASELKAAEPLDGDDLAFGYEAARRVDAIEQRMLVETRRPAVEANERRPGTANVAGDRFRVETAIGGIAVFAPARLAHREGRHGRVGAIVRDPLDDAQARPAVRAVGEGIAVAALERIEDFLGASRADCCVRRNLRVRVAGETFDDAKLWRQRAVEGVS